MCVCVCVCARAYSVSKDIRQSELGEKKTSDRVSRKKKDFRQSELVYTPCEWVCVRERE